MNCADFPWIAYLEEALTDAARSAAAAHLQQCQQCRGEEQRRQCLLREATCVAPASRLGCPPAELLARAPEAAPDWVPGHVASCAPCREDRERLLAMAEAAAAPAALPEAVASRVLGDAARSSLVGELLAVVRQHLGDSRATLERWGAALEHLAGSANAIPAQSYAAPAAASPAEPAAERPVHLVVDSGGVNVDLQLTGPWVRVRAARDGVAAQGIRVQVENELGAVLATETDQHGEALIREQGPGAVTVRVRSGA